MLARRQRDVAQRIELGLAADTGEGEQRCAYLSLNFNVSETALVN